MDLLAEMQSGPDRQNPDRLCHQLGTDTRMDSSGGEDRQRPFADQRSAALALLNGRSRLSRKAGSFCGQCAVDPTPLSEAQHNWLQTLLERAGLPPLANGGDHV